MGMGTTYRSALSWNIKTTVVELVPSVKEAFEYYYPDAARILKNPNGRIVIDDGRRFLNRTSEAYDVIMIDPPPPVEAAASSLLYSEEFYALIKKHLKPKGIFQQWFPGGEKKILQSVARSLSNSFPYIRVYGTVEGWGFHFLASMSPIDVPSAEKMVSRMPATARQDMMEWFRKDISSEEVLKGILKSEVPLQKLLNDDRQIRIIDDRPYNEYYFLRRYLDVNRL
jgi:spermidine synthase